MRVAAIRYINALPLIYGLEKDPEVDLVLDTPSGCFHKLIAKDVDVGLIPIIATQQHDSIRAIKGLGIAAVNRTESVILFSRKPLDKIQSVLTDRSSLTSVILLKIILQERYGCAPVFRSDSISNLHQTMKEYDAALIIGDEAILAEKTDYDHYDLAAEWHSLTGLSFVFAVWACNRPLDNSEVEKLKQSYHSAIRHWEGVYRRAADVLSVGIPFLKRYYNVNLHYQLTRADYEGILKFLTFAAELRYINRIRKDIWM